MVYLTFLTSFNAVHRLWNDALSDAENVAVYGECANRAGHGHLYKLELTLAAPVTAGRPVVMNRTAIHRLIDEVLLPVLQHGNLDTAFGRESFISTGENVVRAIWDLVEPRVEEGARLVRVRLIETPKNSFVFAGDTGEAGPYPIC